MIEPQGLNPDEVAAALKQFGCNELKKELQESKVRIFFLQFNSPMAYVLMGAAILSSVMGEFLNSLAIMTIVLLNSVISFFQESKAQSSMNALKDLTAPKARVKRNGKVSTIESAQVVPGDILILEAGDYVMADARILRSSQLSADESVLTGESMPTEKSNIAVSYNVPLAERKNILYAGTAVSTGSAIAIVLNTGMNTELGKISGLLEKTMKDDTPLQIKMKHLSYKLLWIAALVMLLVLIIGLSRSLPILTIIIYAISLAVAAVPESLATVVTLALVKAVRRMTKRHVILRKLAAVETLGSADVICTDKTGTLTTGQMTVRETFTLNSGISESPQDGAEEFYRCLILCNNASTDHGGSGDTTEIALLSWAEKLTKKVSTSRRLKEWSFDSERKRMSVLVERDGAKFLYCKGAPEAILPFCNLEKIHLANIQTSIDDLTGKGRRLLALSSKQVNSQKDESESSLEFLGLVSLADPPKEGTKAAVESCKASGIRIIMITGDHPRTAEAIAKELGIMDPGAVDIVMTGEELDKLDQIEFKTKSERVAVYARVTSEHKLKIIDALQDNGHIVGMTGDGVNDAPALKKASIGISMGKGGTEVARQASDMILTDDNFSTIVSAIEEGRAVHGNIKRTIQYLLSTNMAELSIVFGTIIFGMPNPFLPISLLWINIATDGLPSLALSVEPVRERYLEESPGPSSKNFFGKKFLIEMLIVGLLITAIELLVYEYALNHGTLLYAKSIAFNLMVYLTLFRSFSCRSDNLLYFQLKLNSFHLLSVFLPITIQILLERNQYFRGILGIDVITFGEHLTLMGISCIPVILFELYKYLFRRKRISQSEALKR